MWHFVFALRRCKRDCLGVRRMSFPIFRYKNIFVYFSSHSAPPLILPFLGLISTWSHKKCGISYLHRPFVHSDHSAFFLRYLWRDLKIKLRYLWRSGSGQRCHKSADFVGDGCGVLCFICAGFGVVCWCMMC
jgi:hypothetical protein